MSEVFEASGLAQLFDSQIQILRRRGCPEQIVEIFQDQRALVIERAGKMTIGEGNIPFVPVIKPVYLGYYGLVAMVRNGNKQVRIYLNPTAIIDELNTLKDPLLHL